LIELVYLHYEERNYEEDPDERHIWLNIKPLKEWVEAERQKWHLGR